MKPASTGGGRGMSSCGGGLGIDEEGVLGIDGDEVAGVDGGASLDRVVARGITLVAAAVAGPTGAATAN
jgi:hypothetical protein